MLDFLAPNEHAATDSFQKLLSQGQDLIDTTRRDIETSPPSRWLKDIQTLLTPAQVLEGSQVLEHLERGARTQSRPTYQYKPIGNDEIRVLHIQPAQNPQDPLICRLEATPITTDYHIALSYAWGPTFDDGRHLTHSIICDGGTLRVTKHLHQALALIRQQASELYLFRRTIRIWVDAICINQASIEERSQQVSKMGEIYLRCEKLIIWLGDSPGWDQPDYRSKSMLELLLCSSWFQRRWVIQEYTLAPAGQRYFLSGRYGLMDSEKLYGSLKASGLLAHAGAIQDVDKPMIDLLDHLHLYSAAQCSVPHDRIYAFLDINAIRQDADDLKKRLNVDYKQSVRDLYVNMAIAEVECRPENVPALLASATTRRHGTSDGLPSWVPDWRVDARYSFPEQHEAVERCFAEERARLYGNASGTQLRLTNMTILSPCFPPRHEANSTCPSCRLCADLWMLSSADMKMALQQLTKDGLMLVLEECGVIFMLSPDGRSSSGTPQWTLMTCFPVDEFKMMPNMSAYRAPEIVIEGLVKVPLEKASKVQDTNKKRPPPVPAKPRDLVVKK